MHSIRRSLAALLLASSTVLLHAQYKPNFNDPAVNARVESLLGKLTPAQKLELIGGYKDFYVHPEPSIGLPLLRMADGPLGVRNASPASTAYPSGIALAASFDTDLAHAEGVAIGRDSLVRGVHFILGPGVNIYRAPFNGRNFEYFGEDPFLAARMTANYIEGVQSQHVSATVKHYALNNEDYDRHRVDSLVDERTLHEIYLPAFEAAVTEANVGAIMDSYNLINGQHATQNDVLNNQIAKGLWKFPGIIMSDWVATYDGPAAARGGLDLEMPSAKFMTPANLKGVPQSIIDDKVRRILRVAITMGWLENPQHLDAPADDPTSRSVAHRAALEGTVLLRNQNNLLPLAANKLCTLAVMGPNADRLMTGGGGSSHVPPNAALTMVEALKAAVPAHGNCPGVVFSPGIPSLEDIYQGTHFDSGVTLHFTHDGASTDTHLDQLVPETVNKRKREAGEAHWTATYTPKAPGHFVVVFSAAHGDTLTLSINGKPTLTIIHPDGHPTLSTTVSADPAHPLQLDISGQIETTPQGVGLGIADLATAVTPEAKDLARKADAVIIAAGFDAATEGEGIDRQFGLLGAQDQLIQTVTQLNKNTIVTLNSGGGIDMSPWIDQTAAVLHLWYGGEEGAPALAEILFGKASPEGHLPISIARQWADSPTRDSYFPDRDSTPDHPQIKLTEGVFLGYRYYTSNNVKPLFPFGFGLSYTTFAFSNLHVAATPSGATVSVDVRNTGTRAGGEAVQVYVGDPAAKVKRPAEELKAFRKVHLAPHESQHVEFALDRRAFSYWSTAKHGWQLDPGKFTITVGDSSENLPMRSSVTVK